MDFIIYLAVLLIAGSLKISKTKSVPDEVTITGNNSSVIYDDIPVGANLALLREPNAYTKILVELGLKIC